MEAQTPIYLPSATKKLIQRIIGTFLYYGLALDLTMLVALGSLATQQANPTTTTWDDIVLFLNYCATNPNATIRYASTDMIMYISSDGSYLSEPKARSRVGGIFYLSNKSNHSEHLPPLSHPFNAPFHVVAKILNIITSSAMETEVAAAFHNAKDGLPFRATLEELGHPQPPTPLELDIETAIGFLNGTMKQRHSKAIDMRFYWVKYRVAQKQFLVYWKPGKQNIADYVSKHHAPQHHKSMRSRFFVIFLLLTSLLLNLILHMYKPSSRKL